MAEPKQKSQSLPTFLTRVLPLWQTPQWMAAERWRQTVYNLPVAMDCRDVLINELIASDWEVRAKDPKEEDVLADDIEGYTNVLDSAEVNGLKGFDHWCEAMGQDLLTIPVGGNTEVVRYPNGNPFSQEHPKGHVFKLVFMDGSTVYPTFDQQFTLAQRLKESASTITFFAPNEIARAVGTVRPELERWGYGMAPPEKVYLAITMLYRGDTYYANLLLDTPEAGLLDLGDMSQQAAEDWVSSFKTLFTGIDPMKIGVLYEHTKEAKYLNFGRPPTEMMFSETWLRYAQVSTSGYGLTLTDVGLGDPGRTLAGSIRDERRSRRSGFAVVREKMRTMINAEIMPPYLEFVWKTKDEETQVQRGRAFLLATQSLKAAIEAKMLTPQEGQAQLVSDGHLTIQVEAPEEPEPLALPPTTNGQAQEELNRIPAGEGGRGDIQGQAVQRALELGDERIAAAPKGSDKFDEMARIIREGFTGIADRMERPRLMKLIKAATREMFPVVEQAFVELSDSEVALWYDERLKMWFQEKSEFDDLPDILKSRDEALERLDGLLDDEEWWHFDVEIAALSLIYKLAFEEGATEAAQLVQEFLYTEGLRDTPQIIGLNFNLKNPRTLAKLEANAAHLVRRVDDGTKFFLKRIITAGVDEGLASPTIAKMIREGAGVEVILSTGGFTEDVIKRVNEEVRGMSVGRTNSIVNTEINRAETDGRVGQWQQMGLTKKAWRHTGRTGPNDPCPVCRANIDLGFVDIDFLYPNVFGEAQTLGPPGHPGTCHCHAVFDEQEMISKAGKLAVWIGA